MFAGFVHIAAMSNPADLPPSETAQTVQNEQPESEGSGRGAHGRFAPGNSIAKGNAGARAVAKFRAALLQAVTEEDVKTIAVRLIRIATGADHDDASDVIAAARLLLAYVVGRPPEAEEEGRGVPVVFVRPAMRDDDPGDSLESASQAFELRPAPAPLPPTASQRPAEEPEAERARTLTFGESAGRNFPG